MPISLLLFWGSVLLAAGGSGLVFYGWIGRRVGEDVFCARCGYDLRGRDLRKLDEQCTECGAKIDRPGATRRGVLHRRPAMITLGLLLALLGLPLLSAHALAAMRGVDLARYKPMWMLRLDAECGDPDSELAAIAEIDRRITAGQVAPDEIGRLAVRGLELAPKRAPRVGQAWATIVHAGWNAGTLPRGVIDALLRDALRGEAFFGGPARTRSPVWFGFRYEAPQNPAAIALDLHEVQVELKHGERASCVPLQANARGGAARSTHSLSSLPQVRRKMWSATDLYAFDPAAEWGATEPGEYAVEAALTVEIRPPKQEPIRYVLNSTATFRLADYPAAVADRAPAQAAAGAGSPGSREAIPMKPWHDPAASTQPAGVVLAPPSYDLPEPPPPSSRQPPALYRVKRLEPVLPERRPAFDAAARGEADLSRIERTLRRSAVLQKGAIDEYEFDPEDLAGDIGQAPAPRRQVDAPPEPTTRPAS